MVTHTKLETAEDAKKYIFAEDFIRCFMFQNGFRTNLPDVLREWDRRSIPKAFTDVVQIASSFLYCRISVFDTFRSFRTNKMISLGTFLLFAQNIETRYFMLGYNAQTFLYFCSHIAYITVSFLRTDDKSRVPTIAVNYIAKTMKQYEFPEAKFWNSLSISAFMYLKIAVECGFCHISVLDTLRVQFVKKKPRQDKCVQDNDGAVSRVLTVDEENNIGKVFDELNDALSIIGDSESNDTDLLFDVDSEIETENEISPTLHEEGEPLSRGDLTESEVGVKDTSYHKNESKNDRANRYVSTTEPMSKKKLAPKRVKKSSKVLNTLVNTTATSVSSKNHERTGCLPMRQSVEFSVTHTVSDRKSLEANIEEAAKNNKQTDCSINLNEISCVKKDKDDSTPNDSTPNDSTPDDSTPDDTSTGTSNENDDVEEESKQKDLLISVDFKASDEYALNMIKYANEVGLFGQSHEEFLSKEDVFNGTFDLLTTLHHMASSHGIQVLDLDLVH